MKKLFSVLLAICLLAACLPLSAGAAGLPFTDVSATSWYYYAVKHAYEHELFSGTSQTAFSPNIPMTRGMLVTVLYRAEGEPASPNNKFPDVRSDWYYTDAISWAAEEGIVSGYGDGCFRPDKSVTREEMVAVLHRYTGSPESNRSLSNFSDSSKIAFWAESAFCWAIENQIITGKGNGILDPQGTATRAEVAQVLWNYEKNVESNLSIIAPDDNCIDYDEAENVYYVNNEILVVAKSGTSTDMIKEVADYIDGQIVGCASEMDMYQIRINHCLLLDLTAKVKMIIENFDYIMYATYDTVSECSIQASNVSVPEDPWGSDKNKPVDNWNSNHIDQNDTNWWIKAIDAQYAWAYNNRLSNIKVGIYDSSFDINHEDLASKCSFADSHCESKNVGVNQWMITSEFVNQHGTHVAGIIGAEAGNGKGITGLVDNCQLILAPAGQTKTSDAMLYDGLRRLVVAGAKIVNFSWGKDGLNAEQIRREGNLARTCIEKLIDIGYDFLVVQAAGNECRDALGSGFFASMTEDSLGIDSSGIYDALNHVIIVGAAEPCGDGYQCTDFSNYGNQVDICAPGKNIYSTWPGNILTAFEFTGGYNYQDGTSMAAPIVSGVCALVWAAAPTLSATEVRSIVLNHTGNTVMPNPNSGSNDVYHMVNAKMAVEYAIGIEAEATGALSGVVCRALDRTIPINGAKIAAYQGGQLITAVSSGSSGKYTANLPAGNYQVRISAPGYISFDTYTSVEEGQTNYMETFLMVQGVVGSSGIASGIISNAMTGGGVSEATLIFRPGWNNTTGNATARTSTDSNGTYSFTLPIGNYTAQIEKSGFVTTSFNIVVQEGTTSSQNSTITPIISGDNFRMVLTWGKDPRDLDSHLKNDNFHVYFRNQSYSSNESTVCRLDVDNTSSYGPETITLSTSPGKTYYYYVHHYAGSGSLTTSEAQVKVYQGEVLVATFNVPTDQQSKKNWNVFAIKDGRLIARNTLTESPDESYAN